MSPTAMHPRPVRALQHRLFPVCVLVLVVCASFLPALSARPALFAGVRDVEQVESRPLDGSHLQQVRGRGLWRAYERYICSPACKASKSSSP